MRNVRRGDQRGAALKEISANTTTQFSLQRGSSGFWAAAGTSLLNLQQLTCRSSCSCRVVMPAIQCFLMLLPSLQVVWRSLTDMFITPLFQSMGKTLSFIQVKTSDNWQTALCQSANTGQTSVRENMSALQSKMYNPRDFFTTTITTYKYEQKSLVLWSDKSQKQGVKLWILLKRPKTRAIRWS